MNNAKDYYNIHSIEYVDKWDLSPKGLEKPANYYRLVLINLLLKLACVKPGEKVVEIGCGTGLVLREVLKIIRPIYGVDISSAMLERIKDSLLKDKKVSVLNDFSNIASLKDDADIFLAQGDILELNLPKNYFDKVLSTEVLRYVDDLPRCFQNIKAIMKSESVFIFTTTNLYSLSLFPIKYSIRKLFGTFDKNKELMHYFVTEGSIKKMLKEAGLEIASFEKLNLLSLNPLVEKLVTDCSGAKKITSWDSKLSKVPVINNFFDTFVISARLKK